MTKNKKNKNTVTNVLFIVRQGVHVQILPRAANWPGLALQAGPAGPPMYPW